MAAIFLLFIFFYEETKYVPTIQSTTPSDLSNSPTTTEISVEEKKTDISYEENVQAVVNAGLNFEEIVIGTSIP